MNEIVSVNSLTKEIKNGEQMLNILKNINLDVIEGEFISIMGASGSGKSTLLGILSGLDNECNGEVKVCGENILGMKDKELTQFRNENIGIVFQSFNLLPDLSILENIKVPLYFSKNKASMNKKAMNILSAVGLKDKAKNYSKQLSGGEQQRVAIARALINNPKLLFADEPTGALDKANGDMILKLLKKFNKEYNMTIVMVTHDNQLAKEADRIIQLEDGQIKQYRNM
ncbi:ABC transporter ATP-binding protein [Anaerosporobacter sp.]